ncbi:MAG TPA: LuxR C-terminal-related transcriptional regulator [Vicinamibacterales bacterium]|nr:LuxR C-terminal-related transcriptional regulator [Vicinamibacterales bacterium]
MAESRPPECREGDAALARGDWASARAAFLAAGDTPEALEGLGLACWWLDEEASLFDARERAYKRYVDRGDRRSAARVAVWVAWDCAAFRGEAAVANGWLQRARRLLEAFPDSAEAAWLEARESQIAMGSDPDGAHRHASEGVRAARAARAFDLEMLNRSLQGLALVSTGAVAAGMRLLDEVNAAVVAGELSDQIAIGLSGCYMLVACDRVRDYDRAVEWCSRLKAYCEKWGLHPLFAVCRTQYASICMWRGTWLEAEQELTAATRELATSRPAMSVDGMVRLAELRRRQGRLVEATSLFEQSARHPAAALGLAELAFDRGDLATAAELGERYLRRVPGNNPTQRAIALDLLVRARTGTGDHEGARTALAELEAIAARLDTTPLRAAACLAAAYVSLGGGDADAARRHAEDALDLFLRSAAPFEVARARIELAKALAALGRTDDAVQEAQRAIDLLTELGAELDIARARTLMATCAERVNGAAPSEPHRGGLTSREVEVLRLVADGLNNQVIARRLFVSEHTIHRHVANILNKLSVSSRAAAVAQAARRGLL